MLVECKSYSPSPYAPSGKIATLNESMLYFLAARGKFRKMLFIAQAARIEIPESETFAEHYVRLYGPLIPRDVEVWELSGKRLTAKRLDTVPRQRHRLDNSGMRSIACHLSYCPLGTHRPPAIRHSSSSLRSGTSGRIGHRAVVDPGVITA